MKSGKVHQGWLSMAGHEDSRHSFDWNRCWQAGKSHDSMWKAMGEHHHKGHEKGHHGGHKEHE